MVRRMFLLAAAMVALECSRNLLAQTETPTAPALQPAEDKAPSPPVVPTPKDAPQSPEISPPSDDLEAIEALPGEPTPAPRREPDQPRDPFAPSPKMRELMDRPQVGAPTGALGSPPIALPVFRLVGYGDDGVHPPVALVESADQTLVVREGDAISPQPGVTIRVQNVSEDGVSLEIEELDEVLVVR